MAAAVPGTASEARGRTVHDDIADELALEDDQLIRPLLRSLLAAAAALDHDEGIDPGWLREGIGLWEEFDTQLRRERVEAVLSFLPEALADPMAARRSRSLHLSLVRPRSRSAARSPTTALRDHFNELHSELQRTAERIHDLRVVVDRYEEGGWGAVAALAQTLREFAVSEDAWLRYEAEFVTAARTLRLGTDLERRVRASLAKLARARVAAASAVRTYVSRPRVPRNPAPAPKPAGSVRRTASRTLRSPPVGAPRP